MKTEFKDYLNEIGISGAIFERAEEIYKFYNEYLKFDIHEIFVCEYIDADGSRVYESLWFFNNKYCFEAKNFIISENYDSDFYGNEIFSFNISKKDFNILQNIPNDNSRLNVTFSFNPDRVGVLKGSKNNCKQIVKIIENFIKPNLKK
jgi:hypothetical protein